MDADKSTRNIGFNFLLKWANISPRVSMSSESEVKITPNANAELFCTIVGKDGNTVIRSIPKYKATQ